MRHPSTYDRADLDDAHDVFDDDEELGYVMPAIYSEALLRQVAHLVREHRGTTFWVYHSSRCQPPRSMAYGAPHCAHNVVLRPSPHIRDGHLIVLDSPILGDVAGQAPAERE